LNLSRHIRHCSTLLTLVLLALLLWTGEAATQVAIGALNITLVDETAFPTVSLYLSVTDLDRQPVTDLPVDAFSVYENDVPIADFTVEAVEHPMLIGIVIDSAVSFNTREGGASHVEHAKEVARWLIAPEYGRLILDDEIGIFAFRDGQPQRMLSDFTYDHQRVLDQGISPVSTAGNQYTALFDILRQAITETSARQGARRRVLLVFSDGIDRTSGIEVDRVIQEAVDAHLLIYTVGLGRDLAADRPGSAFLRRLADETGGRYMWYRPGRAEEEEEMHAFLDALVAQRAGYRLFYASNQYQGIPEVRLAVQRAGSTAEDTATFEVPPLPPVVSVDNLSSGQVLVDTFTIRPSIARAQRDIERVEYYVDEELVHTAMGAPWAFEWDTKPYANSDTEAEAHTLKIVACDIGGQCAEFSVIVGTRLPPPPPPTPTLVPTPTPMALPSDTSAPSLYISMGALVIALGALILLIIVMRRGGMQAVGGVVAEVRRRTRVFRQRTGIFGSGAPAARQSLATLTVVSDMFKDKQFNLEENVVFLGREEDRSDIPFYWDEHVSGRHAKIAQEGAQFYIWDMNSTNGTWVGEQRVPRSLSEGVDLAEAVPLWAGDVIRLGPDLRIRFDLPGGAEQEPSPEANERSRSETPTQVIKPPPAASSSHLEADRT
jgi:hypothetical protein